MWTEFILIGVLVLPSAVSTSLPKPIHVSFSSVNLRNVLQWLPGNGSPHDTHFTVEYGIYGGPIKGRGIWRPVRQCTDIVRTWCDLSAEMQDEEQSYYARVRTVRRKSFSKWAKTPRFDPKSDTVFGPPLVTVEIENNSAIITLKGPMRHSPKNHTSALSMKAIYPHMSYNLSIHNTDLNQMQHIPVVSSPYKYQLEYNTKYCISAKSRFVSIQMQSKSSAWYCLTTPKDPVIEHLQRSLVGIVVPFLFICLFVVTIYLLYNYLSGNDQKSPHILKRLSFFPPPLKCPPENTNLIVISIVKDEPPSHVKVQLGSPDPPPSYSSQSPEVSQELEQPLDDEPIDYGAVVKEDPRPIQQDGVDDGKNLIGADGQSANAYTPQANACLCQRWAQTGDQSHAPKQAQVPNQSRQGSATGEKKQEFSGLFFSRNPETGHLAVQRNVRNQEGVEEVGKTDGKTRGSEEEGNECENIPLLSGYVSQNVTNRPQIRRDQSDGSSVHSSVLTLPAARKAEEDESEREGANASIYRRTETRQLVLPQMDTGLEKGLDGSKTSGRIVKDDGTYMARCDLRLEGEFLKTSEEEEEPQRGEDTEWEPDIFRKWGLILS